MKKKIGIRSRKTTSTRNKKTSRLQNPNEELFNVKIYKAQLPIANISSKDGKLWDVWIYKYSQRWSGDRLTELQTGGVAAEHLTHKFPSLTSAIRRLEELDFIKP